MINRFLAIAFFLLALSGCVLPPMIIADLESDKAVIAVTGFEALAFDPSNEKIMNRLKSKAREACAIHDKQPSDPLSWTTDRAHNVRVLFACK